MLSFIYQIVRDYEREHGFRPNLLYVSENQLSHLRQEFSECHNLEEVTRLLGMDIVVDQDTVHPHVAWIDKHWRHIAVR
jgi:hypothetical protein